MYIYCICTYHDTSIYMCIRMCVQNSHVSFDFKVTRGSDSPATAIIKWSWLGYSWGFSWAADGGYGDIQLSSHGVHVHKLNQLIWGAKEEYLFTILYIYAIYANICMHIQMHTQT